MIDCACHHLGSNSRGALMSRKLIVPSLWTGSFVFKSGSKKSFIHWDWNQSALPQPPDRCQSCSLATSSSNFQWQLPQQPHLVNAQFDSSTTAVACDRLSRLMLGYWSSFGGRPHSNRVSNWRRVSHDSESSGALLHFDTSAHTMCLSSGNTSLQCHYWKTRPTSQSPQKRVESLKQVWVKVPWPVASTDLPVSHHSTPTPVCGIPCSDCIEAQHLVTLSHHLFSCDWPSGFHHIYMHPGRLASPQHSRRQSHSLKGWHQPAGFWDHFEQWHWWLRTPTTAMSTSLCSCSSEVCPHNWMTEPSCFCDGQAPPFWSSH